MDYDPRIRWNLAGGRRSLKFQCVVNGEKSSFFFSCGNYVAVEREVEGDLLLGDMGQGLGICPGVLDGAISISFQEKKYNKKCANAVIKSLGLNTEKIEKCMGDPDADTDNPVLKEEQDAQVKPKHPDFKRKDRNSLWLGKDEKWVLPKLEGLQFDVPTAISKKGDGGEPCNDLVQNYANWWDNRLNKRNAKAPDFKHKETGKGLWLDSSSEWVLEKLPPPLKPKQSVDTERTLVS
ncbi:hypothetical protein JHK87_012031 [Glycine soja]|nr:hypothetical protein JHK87_012031 [Glycine soja]